MNFNLIAIFFRVWLLLVLEDRSLADDITVSKQPIG